jgi:hypothetical protein
MIMERQKPDYQKKYHLSKIEQGLSRIEFFVNSKTKETFETIFKVMAEEYMHPYSEKARQSKAKTALFDQLIRGIEPRFFHMKEQIEGLQAELKAVSPAFFDLKSLSNDTPLPHTIAQLPDDPEQLKALLAHTQIQAQKAEKEARHYKHLYHQQQALATAATDYVSKLKGKLKNAGVDVDKQETKQLDDY